MASTASAAPEPCVGSRCRTPRTCSDTTTSPTPVRPARHSPIASNGPDSSTVTHGKPEKSSPGAPAHTQAPKPQPSCAQQPPASRHHAVLRLSPGRHRPQLWTIPGLRTRLHLDRRLRRTLVTLRRLCVVPCPSAQEGTARIAVAPLEAGDRVSYAARPSSSASASSGCRAPSLRPSYQSLALPAKRRPSRAWTVFATAPHCLVWEATPRAAGQRYTVCSPLPIQHSGDGRGKRASLV
jgi:hypothetical protein